MRGHLPAHQDALDIRTFIIGIVRARQAAIELHNEFDSRMQTDGTGRADRIMKLARTLDIDLQRRDSRGRTLDF